MRLISEKAKLISDTAKQKCNLCKWYKRQMKYLICKIAYKVVFYRNTLLSILSLVICMRLVIRFKCSICNTNEKCFAQSVKLVR